MAHANPLAPGGNYCVIRTVTPNPRFFGLIKKYFFKCCGRRMDRRIETVITKCLLCGNEETVHFSPLAVCSCCGRIEDMWYSESPDAGA